MQILARRYDTLQPVRLALSGPHIEFVEAAGAVAARGRLLPWIAPGFVDLQVNGYGGQEFSSSELTPEKVARIVEQHFAFGVTALCPTLTTEGFDVLRHGLAAIAAACDTSPRLARRIAGIHLEGPYITAEDGPRGAHPARHCRPPDWEEFQRLQEAAGGRIRLVTLSPEYPQAPEFIRQATRAGVVAAIGHTGASGDQIRAAVDAGARLSTHLGNGAHRSLPRHPNYLWDQLAEDRLMASLICDGSHLPEEVIRTFVRAKTPPRCILVSDVSGLAGLPAGQYQSSGCTLEILADGRLVIAGQRQLLAGASRPIGDAIATVMRAAEVSLREAVEMAVGRPAAILGYTPGGLRPGDPGDLVLFDLEQGDDGRPRGLRVRATIADGRLVFGELPQ